MKEYYTIKKNHVEMEEFRKLHPALSIILHYFILYADLYNLPVHITSISSPAEGRVSKTHEQFRAIDVSGKGWSELHVRRIVQRINEVYKNWGTSPVGHPRKAIIWHDVGTGAHFHAQIRRGIKFEL